MNKYPFHELDYLVREGGFELALIYLQDPTESNWEAFRAGVQRDVRHMIDGNFWNNIAEIAGLEADLYLKVQQTFDCCFGLAFWDMKEGWYGARRDHRASLKQQWDHSMALATQCVYNRPEFSAFVDYYEEARERFNGRLTTNLEGYESSEYEKRQVALPDDNDYIALAQEAATPIFQRAIPRYIIYQRIIDRLFRELVAHQLLRESESLRADFRGIFFGPFSQKVDWIGDIQQLTYLIKKLSGSELNDLAVLSNKNKWITTACCFTIRGNSCSPEQLKDTHIPKGRSLTILNLIIAELREVR